MKRLITIITLCLGTATTAMAGPQEKLWGDFRKSMTGLGDGTVATGTPGTTPNATQWLSDVRTTAARQLRWACYGGQQSLGMGGMVDGAEAYRQQRIVGGTGWTGIGGTNSAEPSEANRMASQRLPGSSISCLNQTGMIHTPNANFYITDGQWTQAQIQIVGGMADIVFGADGTAQVNYNDRANSITIAIDQDGNAEVTGLKMDRYSMTGSNEVLTAREKQGYSENEIILAANNFWGFAPAMTPAQFIRLLFGDPKVQRLFGEYLQKARLQLNTERTSP